MKSIKLSQFPEDTYIFLRSKKRKEIFQKLEKKIKYLTRIKNINPGNLYEWKRSYIIRKNNKRINRYIPLPKLKKLCKIIDININDLQPHIKEIKTSSRSGIIKDPKLPLKIIPETFAILGHMLSDGYGGEIGRSVYSNTSKEARENFIKNLKKAFGNVYYSTNKNHPNFVSVAKIVPKILKKYFGIKDFRSSKSKITKKVYNAPKKYLAEFVKAVIIDEGRIADSAIYIEFVVNPSLTNSVKEICEKRLNYFCYNSRSTLLISSRNFHRISKDMKNFIIPHKQERFMRFFKRKNRKWYNRYRGTTKKEIIKHLIKKPMTVSELASKLNLKTSCVYDQISGYDLKGRRILGLSNLNIIKVKKLGYRKTKIFGINNKDKALAFLGDELK